MKWLIGELVTYQAGTKLMKVRSVGKGPVELQIHGDALMGGTAWVGISDIEIGTEEDWDIWDNMRWFRDGANGRKT